MMRNPKTSNSYPRAGWYVFQTQTKREHIAAAMIRSRTNFMTFCPRIAFYRRLKRGKVRFIEPIFPSYVFVNCEIEHSFRTVSHVEGVLAAVRYGTHFPMLPEALIENMMTKTNGGDIVDLTVREAEEFEEGSEVEVVDGPFLNMTALVKYYDRPGERIRLLLEWLGQSIEVDLPAIHVIAKNIQPRSTARSRSPFALPNGNGGIE